MLELVVINGEARGIIPSMEKAMQVVVKIVELTAQR